MWVLYGWGVGTTYACVGFWVVGVRCSFAVRLKLKKNTPNTVYIVHIKSFEKHQTEENTYNALQKFLDTFKFSSSSVYCYNYKL